VSAHGQRGQSLPITAIGIIALLAVGYFSIDYANTIRWQIRAQSAADSAAQAILSIQTQQFNEMTATLYAAAVEEYRIRRNLNAMAMAANLQGGCAAGYDVTNPAGLAGAQSQCEPVYAALQSRFTQAVARYGSEVELLNEITSSLNLPNVVRDSSALVQQLNVGCNGATADCAFGYTIPSGAITARTDTVNVKMDALGIEKPWNATSATSPSGVNANLFAPLKVEVETCAYVPPVIPGFFGYKPRLNQVIGRAAATAVMTEQDWLQPGTNANPSNDGLVFQPAEHYITPAITDPTNGNYDWYDLNFGGTAYTSYYDKASNVVGLKAYSIQGDDFEVWLGWWNSVPIHTFATTSPDATCKTVSGA
jgi:hypothetical protein